MQVNIRSAIEIVTEVLKARLVPMIKGSPGIGKSAITHHIGNRFNLQVIDLRLSQCDPTDLNGFPSLNNGNGRAEYVPMNTFPLEGDPLPEGKNGWLLFLDEFSSATSAVQAAAYKLVLDRMVGLNKLHNNVAIVCAGNKEEDGAIVHTMSTALQSRLVHLETIVDVESWVQWAADAHLDHRIMSFIGFRPDLLYTFNSANTDDTYACPRTWEFAHKLLKNVDIDSPIALPLLSGTLSEGPAREFLAFCRIYRDLPSIDSIMAFPDTAKVPTNISAAWAISGALTHQCTTQNGDKVITYISRLPIEIQVYSLRNLIKATPAMRAHPALASWIRTTGAEMFAA